MSYKLAAENCSNGHFFVVKLLFCIYAAFSYVVALLDLLGVNMCICVANNAIEEVSSRTKLLQILTLLAAFKPDVFCYAIFIFLSLVCLFAQVVAFLCFDGAWCLLRSWSEVGWA